MAYHVEILRLSEEFYRAYPKAQFPELLEKEARPYACLVIEVRDYTICIPYRTNIQHTQAYRFKLSKRAVSHHSGLDYTKMVLIREPRYVERTPAVIDPDEYKETMIRLEQIVSSATAYLDTYICHVNREKPLHPREYARQYAFSTLPYFHDVLGLT